MEEQNVAAAAAIDSVLETGPHAETPQLGTQNRSKITSEGQASTIEQKKAR